MRHKTAVWTLQMPQSPIFLCFYLSPSSCYRLVKLYCPYLSHKSPTKKDSMFPQNFCTRLPNYTVSNSKDQNKNLHLFESCKVPKTNVGRDSSVGIATRYGLDGPGIESRWRRDFPHPSRPALGSTQPSIQWVPGLFPGGKAAVV